MKARSRHRALFLGLALFAFHAAVLSEPLDPTDPPRLFVGEPRGHSPVHHQDSSRRGVAAGLLPTDAGLAWRAQVEGDPIGAPAVDASGRIVVATRARRVVQLDRSGRTEWMHDLANVPSSGVALASGGERVVLTEDGALHGISPEGRLLYRTLLGTLAPPRAALLPLADGTLLASVGRELFTVGPAGTVQARAAAPGNLLSLSENAGVTLAVTEQGDVLSLRSKGSLGEEGTLGGPLTGAFLQISGRRGVGIVRGTLLVEVDLAGRQRRTLSDVSPDAFTAVVETPAGLLVSTTRSGRLLRIENPGSGTAPTNASPVGQQITGTRAEDPDPQLLVADAHGTLAMAGRDTLQLVSKSGVVALPLPECEPLALSPSGPGRLVISCRGGLLLCVDETAASPPPRTGSRPGAADAP